MSGWILSFERADWVATPAAQALIRNNRPLLAWIAGKPSAFTSKDHNFLPETKLEKQIVIINNSRQTVTCEAVWEVGLPLRTKGERTVTVPTGEQMRIPVKY